jgi:hypothetical protein
MSHQLGRWDIQAGVKSINGAGFVALIVLGMILRCVRATVFCSPAAGAAIAVSRI